MLLRTRRHLGMITPTPVQCAMAAALRDDAHVDRQRQRYATRRRVLRTAFVSAGWTIDDSQAGLFLWARHARHGSWESVNRLAALGILVTPGDLYGPAGHRHIRIAITASDREVAAVGARLADA